MRTLDYKAIGQRVKSIRKSRNFTQEQLADFVDSSTSHISNIECGSTKASLPMLIALCNALGVTVNELLADCVDAAARPQFERDLARIVDDCTDAELRAIVDLAAAAKDTLRRNFAPPADG